MKKIIFYLRSFFFRSQLAWKEVCATVPEIKNIINSASSIASYFHKSGIRTKELKKIAKEKNWNLVRFPEFFEVRWTEFSYQLVISILKSWKVLVNYFQNCTEADAKGYLKFLVDKDN